MTEEKPTPVEATVPGVILAGGQARRMGGGDKGLLELGGQTLLARVIARLAPQCGALALNANGDPARLARFGLPVLADPVPGQPGPLAGVLAGMLWATGQGASHVLSVAADTPFFPADLVARLCAAARPGARPGAVAGPVLAAVHHQGRLLPQPTFGLWPVALAGALRSALDAGQRRAGQWAAEQGAALVAFPAAAADPFFNINTPDELAEAARRIVEAR